MLPNNFDSTISPLQTPIPCLKNLYCENDVPNTYIHIQKFVEAQKAPTLSLSRPDTSIQHNTHSLYIQQGSIKDTFQQNNTSFINSTSQERNLPSTKINLILPVTDELLELTKQRKNFSEKQTNLPWDSTITKTNTKDLSENNLDKDYSNDENYSSSYKWLPAQINKDDILVTDKLSKEAEALSKCVEKEDNFNNSITNQHAPKSTINKRSRPVSRDRISNFSYSKKKQLSRNFAINYLDMNKIPSWPPMKRNKICNSDWNSIQYSKHEPLPEIKTNRLFLNSLATLYDGVETSKSTLGRNAGLGLFCTRKEGFKKSLIFTEFVGWLVHRDYAEWTRRQRRASHIVALDKGFLYIDGERFPHFGIGGGSFANDGSDFLGGPGNNSEFYYWYDEHLGRKRIFLKATKNINEGEEIFVPYNKQYWLDNFEEEITNCPAAFVQTKLKQIEKKEANRLLKLKSSAKKPKTALSPSRVPAPKKSPSNTQNKKPSERAKNELSQPSSNIKVKKPLSSFLRFSKEKREELLKSDPSLSRRYADIGPIIGQIWRDLDSESRKKYERDARVDWETYKTRRREEIQKLKLKTDPKQEIKRKEKVSSRKTSEMPHNSKETSNTMTSSTDSALSSEVELQITLEAPLVEKAGPQLEDRLDELQNCTATPSLNKNTKIENKSQTLLKNPASTPPEKSISPVNPISDATCEFLWDSPEDIENFIPPSFYNQLLSLPLTN